MAIPPRDKSLQGLLKDHDFRIALVERRLGSGLGDSFELPPRLSTEGKKVTDWNLVTEPGFYWSASGLNSPSTGSGWFMGAVYVQPQDGRIVQEVHRGDSNTFSVSWSRYWDGSSWRPWRRSDNLLVPTTVSGGVFDINTGRLNLTAGSKTWSMDGIFVSEFRAYRILYQWYIGENNGAAFNLRSGSTNSTNPGHNYHMIYGNGGSGSPVQAVGSNNTFFGIPAYSAYGQAGEIILSEPMYTAGTSNQKRIRWQNNAYLPYGQTIGAGSLNGVDTTAFNGFELRLSSQAGLGVNAGSEAWISVQGIA